MLCFYVYDVTNAPNNNLTNRELTMRKSEPRLVHTVAEVAEQLGIEKSLVDNVKSRWLANEHKRRMPLAPKIGFRSVGNDFRLPRHIY